MKYLLHEFQGKIYLRQTIVSYSFKILKFRDVFYVGSLSCHILSNRVGIFYQADLKNDLKVEKQSQKHQYLNTTVNNYYLYK